MIRCPKCQQLTWYVERRREQPVLVFWHSEDPALCCRVEYRTQRDARLFVKAGLKQHEREVR